VALWLAECAALLHDIGRSTPGPESEHGWRSAELSAPFLGGLPLTGAERDEILHAVRWHNSVRDDTRLLCVLRDADMLDGLGVVGLVRALTSKAALPAYDARGVLLGKGYERPPRSIADQIAFQMQWISFLNTETARALARERVAFMRAFVEQWGRELG
jgi:HD superfamily phosphodiesterase